MLRVVGQDSNWADNTGRMKVRVGEDLDVTIGEEIFISFRWEPEVFYGRVQEYKNGILYSRVKELPEEEWEEWRAE